MQNSDKINSKGVRVNMEKKFKHLKPEEREIIAIRYAAGINPIAIAKEIDKNTSSIYRELKRNKSLSGEYLPLKAIELAKERKSKAHQRMRISNQFLRKYIEDKIKFKKWTPELISGRLKLDYPNNPSNHVSHETIYQYIYNEKPELGLCLPRERHYRRPKSKQRKGHGSKIEDRVSIQERPKIVDERKEFGHFEADCIVSSRDGKGALLTIVERVSRFTTIIKLEQKSKYLTTKALIKALFEYPEGFVQSITYDNGLEFAGHKEVNALIKSVSYFCVPYHSWEKGSIENRNGVIRYFFPKGTDFSKVTEEQINFVQKNINNRPMKLLGFKTPKEVYDIMIKNYLQGKGFAFAA